VAVGYGNGRIFEFSLQGFAQAYKFQQAMVFNSLKILQREGYLEFTEEVDSPSRIAFIISRDELYKFQVANAKLDDFVKLVLRSYTGLFSGYVSIDEDLLVKRSGMNSEQVYMYLKHLRKSNVIDYVPRNRTPFIYFSKERISIDRLKISKENYDVRKKDYSRRIESVIDYASGNSKCRSQMLLAYFGETDAAPCGTCDVCKAKQVLELTDFEFETISKRVRGIIETPCSYEKLLLKLKGDQQKMRTVIKWLLDNKKIIYRVDNNLEWNERK
jgi:ATP-dependent DNA helicase RecQ